MQEQTNDQFMGHIWKITLMTMLGTASIGFALHMIAIEGRHSENLQQVEQVEFQKKQIAEYLDIYKQKGKDAAAALLTSK